MPKIIFAFCTYNRADRLEKLVTAIRHQKCEYPFEILAVNNNSQDNTLEELRRLASLPGAPLRIVTETVQGIVAARNRAVEEAIDSDILIFIDDDEIPQPGLIKAACRSIVNDGAECVGGQVCIDFRNLNRPKWLTDDLLGFLAEVNHGDQAFWIENENTPIWTANVAYDVNIFRSNPSLRFDNRYSRKGHGIGGGEDLKMLQILLTRNFKIRYCPEMAVLHSVEPWRLNRSYFIKLHYNSGKLFGCYELPQYSRTIFGYPPFMISQFLNHMLKALIMIIKNDPKKIRQCMNAAYALGSLIGYKMAKTNKARFS